jgi:hypothetical protein
MGLIGAAIVGTVGLLTILALDFTPLALLKTVIDVRPITIVLATTGAAFLMSPL